MAARFKEKYVSEIKPALAKELNITNAMAIPKLEKIVINMGLGEATQNVKIMDPLVADLAAIAGQKPVTTKAKKSIAAFKVREGMPIGAMVTLRGDKMYEFLDRLISIALPRVRDFRGVSSKSFDGRGNYTLGLRDQLIFAEIDYAKVDKIKGMNVTIVTTAKRRQRRPRPAEGFRHAVPGWRIIRPAQQKSAVCNRIESKTLWQLQQNASKTQRSRSSNPASTTAASSAAVPARFCASSGSAVSASAASR